MVASPGPRRAIRACQQGVDLLTAEEPDEGSVESLGWYGEHPLDELGMLGVAQGSVAEQRVDGGQAGVARAHAVPALILQVVKKTSDQGYVEVSRVELRRLLVQLLRREADQQSQGVSIGSHGLGGACCWRPSRSVKKA